MTLTAAPQAPMLLAGRWVERSQVIEVRDPDDGSLVGTVPAASAADMTTAISAAVDAAREMRRLPAHRRMAALSMAADRIAADADAFAETIAREGVKTIREARREVTRCAETLRISAEEARRLAGETIPFDQRPGSEGRIGYWVREPVGVVGAITPFNDPLNLVAHKVGPAIAAGNAIIVKPHRATPMSALRLAAAFDGTDLPGGALQVVTGSGAEIGDVLVADPRVRMISFTGGRAVGERIAARAGIRKLAMELGSNSPVIVLADAALDEAASSIVSGSFWAAGQNCLHVQRVYVEEAIADTFIERLVAGAAAYRTGPKLDDATDMGPLISEQAAGRVEAMVDEALDAGARLLVGGSRTSTRMSPTILAEAPVSCSIARDEVFGPVTVVWRVRDLDDAIERANATDYGLQAGIFTSDLRAAMRAASELDCGGVMVNESSDYRIDAMPFGGVRGSGLGREGVRFAMEAMTEQKVVCFVP
jgi:glyceraldehyde-3-phosphate dehydrogenase (NADP+)